MIKSFVKRLLPKGLLEKYHILKGDKVFFSQFGEDQVVNAIFDSKPYGFYVDIGAYHPTEISNTCYFSKKGWIGINVEPTPSNYNLFVKNRNRDINKNMIISSKEGATTFYIFREGALNTTIKELADEYVSLGYHLDSTIQIESLPLSKLLDRCLPKNQQIDFLSIDVEGADLEVLQTNDWNKYVPKVILIEDLKFNFNKLKENQIHKFLQKYQYGLCSVAGPTLVYIHKSTKKWYNQSE